MTALVTVRRQWPPSADPRQRPIPRPGDAPWEWTCVTGGCAEHPCTGHAWTATAANEAARQHLADHPALDRARAALARMQQRLDDANARAAGANARYRNAVAVAKYWADVAAARDQRLKELASAPAA